MNTRQITVRVEGNSAAEMEQSALDQAGNFFGLDPAMDILPYEAHTYSMRNGVPPRHQYWAEITIAEQEG